jgi:hypothetical protein
MTFNNMKEIVWWSVRFSMRWHRGCLPHLFRLLRGVITLRLLIIYSNQIQHGFICNHSGVDVLVK